MSGPLSTSYNLAAAKTAFPMPQKGVIATWRCTGVTSEMKDLKEESVGMIEGNQGRVLKFEFELVNPVPDCDGVPILPGKPGSKMTRSINLFAKVSGKSQDWFVRNICDYVDALIGTADSDNKKGKPPRPSIDLASPTIAADLAQILVSRELMAKMDVRTNEGNTFSDFEKVYFPADLAAMQNGGAK